MHLSVSESRTYVALSLKLSGGYFFTKFVLPEGQINDSTNAARWFQHHKEKIMFVQGCVTFEDYSQLEEMTDAR